MTNKRKISSILSAIVLVALIIIVLKNFYFKKTDLPYILESGRLTVVTDSGSTGFAFKNDSIYGFQYEMVKAFADSLGVELQISQVNDPKKALGGLQSGEYDIVANAMPITSNLQQGIVFCDPFFSSSLVLIQHLSDDSIQNKIITNQCDLGNDTIYVTQNSVHKFRIENLSDEIAEKINIIEIPKLSLEAMVRLVSAGKIKNTVCNEEAAKRFKKQFPNIDISLHLGFNQNYSWALSAKSPLLLEKLNDFLAEFTGSTAYWELYRKYY